MPNDTDATSPRLAPLVGDTLAALDLDGVTPVGNDTGRATAQTVVIGHPATAAGGSSQLASLDSQQQRRARAH